MCKSSDDSLLQLSLSRTLSFSFLGPAGVRKEAGRGVSLCLPRSPPLQPLNSTRVERRGSRERCRKSDREEGEAKKKNTPKAEDGRQCAHAIFY